MHADKTRRRTPKQPLQYSNNSPLLRHNENTKLKSYTESYPPFQSSEQPKLKKRDDPAVMNFQIQIEKHETLRNNSFQAVANPKISKSTTDNSDPTL